MEVMGLGIPILSIVTYIPLVGAFAIVFLLPKEKTGSIKTLAEWKQKYDGEFRSVEADLSELAGKKAKFILTVQTRGDYTDDTAFWLMPRIMR